MQKKKYSIFIFLLLCISGSANAQDVKDTAGMNYTYIGPVLSASYTQVEYRDWIDNSTQTKKMSGTSYAGGIAIDIFAGELCGDFHLKYSYSQLDYAITCLEFSMSGKYLFTINDYFSLGAGLGLYFETPPSNQEHNGATGLQLPLMALFNTTPDSKLFFDLFARYGTFGKGENSQVLSAGINVGFVYKVGRI